MSHINPKEQLLSKQLNTNFKYCQSSICGVQNSVFLKIDEKRILLSINCYTSKSQIKYELCIIDMQTFKAKRLPIYIINEEEFQKDLCSSTSQTQLGLSQNPRMSNHFFIHIRNIESKYRSDRILISILNLDKLQQLDKMLCFRINAKYRTINKVKWHKFSPQCLCILYDQLQFEIYNYTSSPTLAKSCIDLKYLKSKTQEQGKKHFVDFCFSPDPISILDKFIIYFQSSSSTIFSCFPVLADQMKLTSQDIRQLQENSDKSDDFRLLNEALPQEIIQKQIQIGQTTYAIKLSEDSLYDDNVYCYLLPCSTFQKNNSKSENQDCYETLFIIRIGEFNISVQSGKTSDQKSLFFRFSILSHENALVKHTIYPIIFHQCQLQGIKEKMPILPLSQQSLGGNIFYSNAKEILQLNIEGLEQGILKKNLMNQKAKNLIQVSLLIQLPGQQHLKCLNLTKQYLYIVRSNKSSDKFNTIPLYSLGIVNQLSSVLQNFQQNIKNSESFNKKKPQQQQKIANQIKDPKQKNKFEIQQMDKLQDATVSYTSNLKNLISYEARNITKLYQKSLQLEEKFNDKFRKRKELVDLIQKAQENNEKIKILVAQEPKESKLNKQQPDQADYLSNQLRLLQRNINSIKESRKKQFDLDQYAEQQIKNEADQILYEMRSLRQQLQQIKKEKLGK